MADKFLKELEIEEIQELMAMTKAGRMLINKGRLEGRLEGMVDLCKEMGLTLEAAIVKIVEKFDMPEEVTKEMIMKYWNE